MKFLLVIDDWILFLICKYSSHGKDFSSAVFFPTFSSITSVNTSIGEGHWRQQHILNRGYQKHPLTVCKPWWKKSTELMCALFPLCSFLCRLHFCFFCLWTIGKSHDLSFHFYMSPLRMVILTGKDPLNIYTYWRIHCLSEEMLHASNFRPGPTS